MYHNIAYREVKYINMTNEFYDLLILSKTKIKNIWDWKVNNA